MSGPVGAEIVAAESEEFLPDVRRLFVEYGESLGFDLCFQGFREELAGLPGRYASPRGRLYVARVAGEHIGCVGLRPMEDDDVCEMKRLYVQPPHRGHGIARGLVYQLILDAKRIGYRRMYLDTIETMDAAIGLYRSVGFVECDPYSFHPVPGTKCFELMLHTD